MAALAAATASGTAHGLWARTGGALVSFATALVILAATMLPFFSSAWIDFEQDRAGAAALTGYAPADVHGATDSIVHDLLFGGAFAVQVGGVPVLDTAEQSHMRDVRDVFGGLALAALVSLIGLAVVAWRARSSAMRAAAWAGVRRGAASLATLLVVLGVFAVVAFDAAFELFHRVLFPGGNFDFDPRTEKLVQLFPEQFWSDTALVYGAVAIGVSLVVAWYARRRGATATGGNAAGATAGGGS